MKFICAVAVASDLVNGRVQYSAYVVRFVPNDKKDRRVTSGGALLKMCLRSTSDIQYSKHLSSDFGGGGLLSPFGQQ